MELTEDIRDFFNKKLDLPTKLQLFIDIRKYPVIDLRDIIVQILLMPFFGMTSLLNLDRFSRKKSFKKLFKCKRKMVSSDTTVKRALNWLCEGETRLFLLAFLPFMEKNKLLQKKLTTKSKFRRIGILDGSFMGGHYHETFSLHGEIAYPVFIEDCGKRGKELSKAYSMLKDGYELLGGLFPDLLLFDSLYFNQEIFKLVRKRHSHLLIKSSDPGFRTVLSEAKYIIDRKNVMETDVVTSSGFDGERMCRWTMESTSGKFAGYPVSVSHLVEFYPKNQESRQHAESWITTTDLSLNHKEIREASHFRWQIENNVFKRLSHIAGTKRFYCKNSKAFYNMLRIFCAAVAIFDTFIKIFSRDKKKMKLLLGGIKPTWKNIFSQVDEYLEGGIFRY